MSESIRPVPTVPEARPLPNRTLFRKASDILRDDPNDVEAYKQTMAEALHLKPEEILDPNAPDYIVPENVREAFVETFGEDRLSTQSEGISSRSDSLPPSISNIEYVRGEYLCFFVQFVFANPGMTREDAISLDDFSREVRSMVDLRFLLVERGFSQPVQTGGGGSYEISFSKHVPPEQVEEELKALMRDLAKARPVEE